MKGIVILQNSKMALVLSVVLIGVLLGIFPLVVGSINSVVLLLGLFLIILTIFYPIYVNILILGIWGIFQGVLTNVSVFGNPLSQLIIILICIPLFIGLLLKGKIILKREKSSIIVIYLIWAIWNIIGVFNTYYTEEAIILYTRFFLGALIFIFFCAWNCEY